jgi:hypothetical protein
MPLLGRYNEHCQATMAMRKVCPEVGLGKAPFLESQLNQVTKRAFDTERIKIRFSWQDTG